MKKCKAKIIVNGKIYRCAMRKKHLFYHTATIFNGRIQGGCVHWDVHDGNVILQINPEFTKDVFETTDTHSILGDSVKNIPF